MVGPTRVTRAEVASRATVLGGLAAVALLPAGVGLYANGSDMTTQRTVEIGVRMALGADGRATVLVRVTSRPALVGAGLAVGLAAAVALSRVSASLLFGGQATDPVTCAAAAALISSWPGLHSPARCAEPFALTRRRRSTAAAR